MDDEAVDGMVTDIDHNLDKLKEIPDADLYQCLLNKINDVPTHSGYDLKGLVTAQRHITNVAYLLRNCYKRLDSKEAQQLVDRLKIDMEKLSNRVESITHTKERKKKSTELMKLLNIPYYVTEEDAVRITDLYDILMNDDKLSELVAKLKLKAFW